jgi:hypothetical protein
MLAALRTDVHTWAVSYKARKAHGPTMPVASVQDGVRAAQEELERHFGPYVTSASHAPGDRYHPGTYNAAAMVAPASSRVITPGHRLGWTGYWMTLSSGSAPQSILNTYHPDAAEQARVRDLFANNPANHPDIDDAIHGWPAEAGSGTIFLAKELAELGEPELELADQRVAEGGQVRELLYPARGLTLSVVTRPDGQLRAVHVCSSMPRQQRHTG